MGRFPFCCFLLAGVAFGVVGWGGCQRHPLPSQAAPLPPLAPVADSCVSSFSVSLSGAVNGSFGPVYAVDFAQNRLHIINGNNDLIVPIAASSVGNPAFTPDGKRLFLATDGILAGSLGGFALFDTDPSDNPAPVTYQGFDSGTVGFVAIDPSGAYAYFADGCGVGVMDIQPASPNYEKLVGVVTGFTAPLVGQAAFTPDGKQLWWLEDGPYGNPSLVAVINSNPTSAGFASKHEITLPAGSNPEGISVSADGTRAFLSMWGSGGILVLNTSTFKPVTTFTGGSGYAPRGNTLSPDGSTLWVVTDGGTYLEKFSVNTATDTYNYLTQLQLDTTTNNVHYVWLSKDGQTAYVPGYNLPLLYEVDTAVTPPVLASTFNFSGGNVCFLAVHP